MRRSRANDQPWSDLEDSRLRAIWAAFPHPDPLPWSYILQLFPHRSRAAITAHVYALGLDPRRNEAGVRRRTRAEIPCEGCGKPFAPPKKSSRFCSTACARTGQWERVPHPRGQAGRVVTEDERRRQSEVATQHWQDLPSDERAARIATWHQGRDDALLLNGPSQNGHSRARGGKRADLDDRYFRSAWEANYARYLNWLVAVGQIKSWDYEPVTFEFTTIKRGVRFYTPDFRIWNLNGSYEWHEVKGWMDAKSRTRLSRFARYYPDEPLVLIDGDVYKGIAATAAPLIPMWE